LRDRPLGGEKALSTTKREIGLRRGKTSLSSPRQWRSRGRQTKRRLSSFQEGSSETSQDHKKKRKKTPANQRDQQNRVGIVGQGEKLAGQRTVHHRGSALSGNKAGPERKGKRTGKDHRKEKFTKRFNVWKKQPPTSSRGRR